MSPDLGGHLSDDTVEANGEVVLVLYAAGLAG